MSEEAETHGRSRRLLLQWALHTALGGLTAAALAAEVGLPEHEKPVGRRVPPEVATLGYLHRECGFSFSFPPGKFSDRRKDNRRDMARATWEIPGLLRDTFRRLQAPPWAATRWTIRDDAERRRLATLADPDRLRKALAWFEPLLTEFAAELEPLGGNAARRDRLRAEVRGWSEEAETLAARVRKHTGLPTPRVPGEKEVERTVFQDLSVYHPAYAALTWLEQKGHFTGYPEHTFDSRRALTRYEHSMALHRMVQSLKRVIVQLPGGAPHTLGKVALASGSRVVCSPGPTGVLPGIEREAQIRAALARESGLRGLLIWLRPLVVEFSGELALLGSDVQQTRADLDAWEQNAAEISARARVRR